MTLLVLKVTLLGVVASASAVYAQSIEELRPSYLESVPGGAALPAVNQQIITATNAFREEHKLAKLAVSTKLTRTARYFASYMSHTGEYGHKADGNRPAQRAQAHGYEYCFVAENIAFILDPEEITAEKLAGRFMSNWKQSQGHRENMLDSAATEIGVAVGQNPKTKKYYAVQMFGRPKTAKIRFQLVNKTNEAIDYSLQVDTSSGKTSEPDGFQLKPRGIHTHSYCRPVTAKIESESGKQSWDIADNRKYVLTANDSGIDIANEPLPAN